MTPFKRLLGVINDLCKRYIRVLVFEEYSDGLECVVMLASCHKPIKITFEYAEVEELTVEQLQKEDAEMSRRKEIWDILMKKPISDTEIDLVKKRLGPDKELTVEDLFKLWGM